MKWFTGLCAASVGVVLLADIWWFDTDDYRVGANVSLIYIALLTAVFTARYAFWSRWWNSRVGPTYLALKLLMTLVLWQIVIATWWELDYPGRQQIRFAIYSLGAVAVLAMINRLVHEQRRGRDEFVKPPDA